MKKLWNYGVRGQTHSWIKSFLMNRLQRVMVDGENSEWVKVESGVPQGTVLGPVLFLSYIDDLPNSVKHSHVRLFADDCVLYRQVKSESDCELLQDDLQNLEKWEQKWSMSFNPSKCNSINITRKHKKITHSFSLHNQTSANVISTTNLGVELASDLTWSNHINKTCAKGNKQLAFLRRNLQVKNREIKSSAYIGLVRPSVEYFSTIWDPHFHKYIDNIEKIQRRAARFVFSVYRRKAPVTAVINNLGWKSLELRHCRKARLTMFFKIQQNPVVIPLPPFIIRPARPKPDLPHVFRVVYASTKSYRNSFYIRTIKETACLSVLVHWSPSHPSCQYCQYCHPLILPVSTGTLVTLSSFKDAISPTPLRLSSLLLSILTCTIHFFFAFSSLLTLSLLTPHASAYYSVHRM